MRLLNCFTSSLGLVTNRHLKSCCLFVSVLLICACSTSDYSQISTDSTRKVNRHQVQKGDSVAKIAALYQMSSAELIELNKLKNPDKLEVGQVLHVFGLLDLEASLERGKRPAASVRLPNPKSLGLKLSEPIEKLKLSSGFGPRGSSFHEGLDFVAPEGTPIFSAHTGEVIYSGWGMSGFGNLIAIRGNGFFSLYAHNSKNLVYKGDVIERGQQIALVGSTGRATAAHLHFELRVRGSDGRFYAVDPKPLF